MRIINIEIRKPGGGWWATVICFMLIVNLVSAIFLFPISTVLQISFGFSWPIVIPDRKAFTNVAFQFNYNLPNKTSNLYSAAHFPYSRRSLDTSTMQNGDPNALLLSIITSPASSLSRDNVTKVSALSANAANASNVMSIVGHRHPRSVQCHRDVQSDEAEMTDSLMMEEATLGMNAKLFDAVKYHDIRDECHGKRDMGAGELYRTFEQTLADFGFEPSCLQKSVCELARHPLHIPDGEEDVLAEMLHFVLTPTLHNGFFEHESDERDRYEAAETAGRNGADCDSLYPECENSVLHHFTSLKDDPLDENII